jgi:hypothetical protein
MRREVVLLLVGAILPVLGWAAEQEPDKATRTCSCASAFDDAVHGVETGALDVVGITPDVPVPAGLANPLEFAVRVLAQ